MREILFRGFYKDESGKEKVYVKGEWIKGYWVEGGIYYQKSDEVKEEAIYIIGGSLNDVGCAYEVISETVGQYTGLKDKNGKKIFEGDIVKHYTDCSLKEYSVDTGRVFWYQKTQRYLRTSSIFFDDCAELFECHSDKYKVIGNIHSNPELPEV